MQTKQKKCHFPLPDPSPLSSVSRCALSMTRTLSFEPVYGFSFRDPAHPSLLNICSFILCFSSSCKGLFAYLLSVGCKWSGEQRNPTPFFMKPSFSFWGTEYKEMSEDSTKHWWYMFWRKAHQGKDPGEESWGR